MMRRMRTSGMRMRSSSTGSRGITTRRRRRRRTGGRYCAPAAGSWPSAARQSAWPKMGPGNWPGATCRRCRHAIAGVRAGVQRNSIFESGGCAGCGKGVAVAAAAEARPPAVWSIPPGLAGPRVDRQLRRLGQRPSSPPRPSGGGGAGGGGGGVVEVREQPAEPGRGGGHGAVSTAAVTLAGGATGVLPLRAVVHLRLPCSQLG